MFLSGQFSHSSGSISEPLERSSPLSMSLAMGRSRGLQRNAEHVVDDPCCGCLTCMSDSGGDGKPAPGTEQTATFLVADEPTRAVTVGGSLSGVIGTSGDTDVITVNLVAGQTYTISLRGTGATPLSDAYLTVLNPSGGTVGIDDDGGIVRDSLLTFTASTTGTYQIVAEGYPGDGVTGGYTVDVRVMGTDSIGSTIAGAQAISLGQTVFGFIENRDGGDMYSITLEAGAVYSFNLAGGADYSTDPTSVPRGELDTIITIYDASGNVVASNDDISYPDDVSSALTFSSDAGGTYYVKVSAYPRQTGGYALEVAEIDLTGLDPLDTIDWGTQLPSNAVTVYFAPAGQTFDGITSLGWTQYEKDQAMAALQTWAEVSNLTFTITTNSSTATFKLVTTTSNDFLGYFNPPGTTNAGVGVFATNGSGWDTTGGLEEGGYGFITLVHEFGHGLGLAHPHDNGGTSTVMPGVTSPFDSYGVYDLNQGVYTTMSYNDGWQLHPSGPVGGVNYGYQGGPGAFDVALIQLKYGASSNATGNNVYVLPTANAAGAFWDIIWDTGGNDSIVHNGTVAATIDLTAATLDYSATGAGVISFVNGVYGGFTIAAGVVIENASGGSGADVIIGNSANNLLDGGAGNDTLQGRGGNDIFKYETGDGQDTITDFGSGDKLQVHGYTSVQSVTQSGSNVIAVFAAGHQVTFLNTTVAVVESGIELVDAPPPSVGPTEGNDNLTGTSGDDIIDALGGNDIVNGLAGSDTLHGGTGNDILNGGQGLDYLYGGDGDDIINAGDTNNFTIPEYIWDGAGNDFVYGEGGQDIIYGSAGNDYYDGGTGGTQSFEGDAVIYSAALAGILVDMRLGSGQVSSISAGDVANVGVDTLVNIEGVTGSPFADTMIGGEATDSFNGGDGDDTLTGNGGNDGLTGWGGNDVINGGAGADSMTGGVGDDIFYVDNAGDLTIENLGEGLDTVYSSVTHTLAANVERLTLTGTAAIDGIGNELANSLTGNNAANLLDGAVGDDLLSGGEGNDVLVGGAGNDTLSGDGGGDRFEFSLGSGEDTITDFAVGDSILIHDYTEAESITQVGADVVVVLSTSDRLTFLNVDAATVAAAINFEGAWIVGTEGGDTLAGTDGDDRIRALGGNDTISAGAGHDVLDGGAGDDKMIGGMGDDIYYVDNVRDVVSELSNQGNDEVRTTVTYTLARNVENGRLEGTAAINLTGNALNNVLTGNASSNILNGGNGNDTLDGGVGADSLVGGKGNDVYYVDDALDKITEGRRGGTDEVRASVDYALASGVEIETLIAIGSAFVNLTGNAIAQTLQGNDGDNLLYGLAGNDTLIGASGADSLRGGMGNDVLTGGSGSDLFVFEANNGADQITDFMSGEDKLDFRLLPISMANVETTVSGENTIVSVDADGDGRADFTITLNGVTGVAPSDYIFG